jgi:cell division protein FtsI/penicillin-binding protein 2
MTRRGFLALTAVGRYESMARLIEREMPVSGTEYLLLTTGDASVIAERWERARTPAPLGSLVKPFVALAYGEAHLFEYPRLTCAGCWLPRGHGSIGIRAALAQSCNSYFTQLAGLTALDDLDRTARRYGLTLPVSTSPESLIGRYGNWRATPFEAARAYNELVHRRSEPGVALVFDALRLCARSGTAAALGAPAAAKTGTAPCVHSGAPGDGLVAAMFPESSPEFVLLVRSHGVPGAECARRAGPFVREVLK